MFLRKSTLSASQMFIHRRFCNWKHSLYKFFNSWYLMLSLSLLSFQLAYLSFCFKVSVQVNVKQKDLKGRMFGPNICCWLNWYWIVIWQSHTTFIMVGWQEGCYISKTTHLVLKLLSFLQSWPSSLFAALQCS